jgi:hypothetical protein
MSEMNQAAHDYIVFKLAEALKLLVQAKYDTPVLGYKAFDLAIGIVHGCQKTFGDTWDTTRDANKAMPDLISARRKLFLVNAGAAASSVSAAIKHFDDITTALEHRIDVSASNGTIKSDPNGAVQYGLIAEEVDKVYPELVIRDDSGKIQGVRYDELTPMLLNEVQQQRQMIAAQNQRAAAQAAEIRDLRKLLVEMQAGLIKLKTKDELVAQR